MLPVLQAAGGSTSLDVEAITARVFPKVQHVLTRPEWDLLAPVARDIERLKRERDAVVLAHNYMTPDIFHGVADITGDSLALAREAARIDASVLVVAGVHFMAETAKIVNPQRIVLAPDPMAGCSLASSLTAADVRALRAQHPGAPVVVYVNTTAEVKAEADLCCTSGNAVRVVEALKAPKVIFLPDRWLAHYVAERTQVEIVTWEGACEVHERFSGADIARYRRGQAGLTVIAHPECPDDVQRAADFVGSTAEMIRFARDRRPKHLLMLTECSMSDNLATELPDIDMVRPCSLCPHMKLITLEKIRDCLERLAPQVEIAPDVAARARLAVERMLAIGG
jgi:quinolinate synthase